MMDVGEGCMLSLSLSLSPPTTTTTTTTTTFFLEKKLFFCLVLDDDDDENVTVLILVEVKIARWMIFCDNISIFR